MDSIYSVLYKRQRNYLIAYAIFVQCVEFLYVYLKTIVVD